MLTPGNIATLRSAVYRSQNRRSDEPRAVVTFEGGPLDGIRLSVLQREAVSPSMGFCTVTDTGPVQVLYRDGGHGRRVFEGVARSKVTPRYSREGWTDSGLQRGAEQYGEPSTSSFQFDALRCKRRPSPSSGQ